MVFRLGLQLIAPSLVIVFELVGAVKERPALAQQIMSDTADFGAGELLLIFG